MTDPDLYALDPYDMDRFVRAQDAHGMYDEAAAELRRGSKNRHWMWFVFPQLVGLGRSVTSQRFAISGIAEAVAYLEHPVLGPRLDECTQILLATEDKSADEIFGSVDAQKLSSCMTLFQLAAPERAVFGLVLNRYFDGEPDPWTIRLLAPHS